MRRRRSLEELAEGLGMTGSLSSGPGFHPSSTLTRPKALAPFFGPAGLLGLANRGSGTCGQGPLPPMGGGCGPRTVLLPHQGRPPSEVGRRGREGAANYTLSGSL